MDCSKTINFFSEANRLCDSRTECSANEKDKERCPLYDFCRLAYSKIYAEDAKMAIESLQKWSNERQKKTYAQDFFERFPDAQKHNSTKGRYPAACRNTIYGGGCMGAGSSRCWKCWNEPMEE